MNTAISQIENESEKLRFLCSIISTHQEKESIQSS